MAFGSGGGGERIHGGPGVLNLSQSLESPRGVGPRSTPKSASRSPEAGMNLRPAACVNSRRVIRLEDVRRFELGEDIERLPQGLNSP